jgi:hypothetical protein
VDLGGAAVRTVGMGARTAIGTGFAVAATLVPGAAADGLPIAVPSPDAIESREGDVRYEAVPSARRTVVARRTAQGEVATTARIPGRFGIPAVALDGSPSGLSADGGTLVLIRPRVTFPQKRTRLAILDAERLRLSRRLTLPGDFSFDAVSPDGSWLYLIQYTSPVNPTRYAVRAFDVRRARLTARSIVDPREPDEAMRGYPLTRTTDAAGRWAYTLYDGAGAQPFVHALDTTGRTAACIGLDELSGHLTDLRLRLSPDGKTLAVEDGPKPVALVDTTTKRPVPVARAESGGPVLNGTTAAVAMAVVLVGGLCWLAFRRPRT